MHDWAPGADGTFWNRQPTIRGSLAACKVTLDSLSADLGGDMMKQAGHRRVLRFHLLFARRPCIFDCGCCARIAAPDRRGWSARAWRSGLPEVSFCCSQRSARSGLLRRAMANNRRKRRRSRHGRSTSSATSNRSFEPTASNATGHQSAVEACDSIRRNLPRKVATRADPSSAALWRRTNFTTGSRRPIVVIECRKSRSTAGSRSRKHSTMGHAGHALDDAAPG